MDPADVTLTMQDLADPAGLRDLPMAFLDLTRISPDGVIPSLPGFPLVGIGSPDHPLANRLDAMIEPRFSCEAVLRSVVAQPTAARVVTQLLRFLAYLPDEEALTAESLAYATLQGSASHRNWIAARPAELAIPGQGRVALTREDEVLTITLDRAEAGNAIDRAMRDALHEAFALANADTSIKQVILKGNGRSFSLGAELAEFGTTIDPAAAHAIRCLTLPAREAIWCRDRLVAHIDGACIGAGLELAAFAARISATRRAWFQLPELAMGILPGAGGCVSLGRRIGRQRTLLMILSGRRLGAREALEWGLVDALVDDPA